MSQLITYFSAAILGIVQGLTEFLPVSSSGHLVIFQHFPFIKDAIAQLDMMTFDIFLHLATLVSVVIVFRKDISKLVKELFKMLADLFRGKPNFRTPYRRMIIMLLIAVIPAAVIGLAFKTVIAGWFTSLAIVGFALLITACMTYLSDKFVSGKKSAYNAGYGTALSVGIFQALAMVPGISRSGATIFGGLINGYDRRFAVKFSFLLSIPTIFGAAVVQAFDLAKTGLAVESILPYIVGGIFAAAAGVLAIKFLIKLLSSKRFYLFSIYCAMVGAAIIVYGIFNR